MFLHIPPPPNTHPKHLKTTPHNKAGHFYYNQNKKSLIPCQYQSLYRRSYACKDSIQDEIIRNSTCAIAEVTANRNLQYE